MSLYITEDELKLIYHDAFSQDVSESVLVQAVSDYNGRMDNFADDLVDVIIHNINEGVYDA